MLNAAELREQLHSLTTCFSKAIEILDLKVGQLNFASEGLEGVLSVRLHRATASVAMIPKPEGTFAVEIWPDAGHLGLERYDMHEKELYLHLESAAACWKARLCGTAERVYFVPKPLIAELWMAPKERLDLLVSKCGQLPSIRTVARTRIHAVLACSGAMWWLTLAQTTADTGAGYAARAKNGPLASLRSRSCCRRIRSCLQGLGAASIRSL